MYFKVAVPDALRNFYLSVFNLSKVIFLLMTLNNNEQSIFTLLTESSLDYTWLYIAVGAVALILYVVVLIKVLSTFRLVRFGPFKFDRTEPTTHTNNRYT